MTLRATILFSTLQTFKPRFPRRNSRKRMLSTLTPCWEKLRTGSQQSTFSLGCRLRPLITSMLCELRYRFKLWAWMAQFNKAHVPQHQGARLYIEGLTRLSYTISTLLFCIKEVRSTFGLIQRVLWIWSETSMTMRNPSLMPKFKVLKSTFQQPLVQALSIQAGQETWQLAMWRTNQSLAHKTFLWCLKLGRLTIKDKKLITATMTRVTASMQWLCP